MNSWTKSTQLPELDRYPDPNTPLSRPVLHLPNTEWFQYSFSLKGISLKLEDTWYLVKAGFLSSPLPAQGTVYPAAASFIYQGSEGTAGPPHTHSSLPTPAARDPQGLSSHFCPQ